MGLFDLFRRKVNIEGVARMIQTRQQQKYYSDIYESVLDFRIKINDKEGNITNLIPVEMCEKNIQGYIVDGDTVRLKGRIKDGVIKTKEVLNISTNSKVRVK